MRTRLALHCILILVMSGCAHSPVDRVPQSVGAAFWAPPQADEVLEPLLRDLVRASGLGEDRAAEELVRIFNQGVRDSRFSRIGLERVRSLDELLAAARESAAEGEVLEFFRGYRGLDRALQASRVALDESFAAARERFIQFSSKKAVTSPDRSSGDAYLRDLNEELGHFVSARPGWRGAIDRMSDAAREIWRKTRLKLLGLNACRDFGDDQAVERLAQITEKVADDVRASAHVGPRELDQMLDQEVAAETGEPLKSVRANRICPLIIQCEVFDRTRGAGCRY